MITSGVAMIGAFIAARAKEPKLALDDGEAKQIAERAEHVASYYNVPISPVTQAWVGLAGCIGMIYYSKIAAIRFARSLDPKPEPQRGNAPSPIVNGVIRPQARAPEPTMMEGAAFPL